MLPRRLIIRSLIIFFTSSLGSTADPPFLFPHGYFDSAKLKPFDAIYLNLMAQSNLEYGGITLEELDQLDASRKVVPRPLSLPRNREEDDVLLDRMPLPLDTDEIAPRSKSGESSDLRPPSPFSSLVDEIVTTSGGAREDAVTIKSSSPTPSGFMLTAPEPESPQARPMGIGGRVVAENRGEEQPKKPPSPFRLIRRMQRIRRATDEENPFEEIVTRAPPRDQMQFQLVRKMLRRTRHKKRKHRFLTRDDIYDPKRAAREKMTRDDMRKLREELALKPLSSEPGDDAIVSDVARVTPKETIGERHLRRPQLAPTEERFETDLRPTPTPAHMPTLVPTIDRAPRLSNNPFGELDISEPTVVHLPIPPPLDEEFQK